MFILATFFVSVQSQDNDKVVAFGKLKIEWGENENAKITLYQDGKKVDNFYTKNNGKFEFILQLNHQYTFWFEKSGYVTKKVEFNTQVPDKVLKNPDFEPFPDFDFNVTLFKIYPDVDTMFFEKPVGKIQYNASLNDFDYDKDYNLEIIKQMEEIEKKIKEKHEEAERVKNEKELAENNQNKTQKQNDVVVQNQNQTHVVNTSAPDTKIPVSGNEVKVLQDTPKTEEIQETSGNSTRKNETTEIITKSNTLNNRDNPESQTNELSPQLVDIPGKTTTKTSITQGNITLIYIKVEYKWGGRYFFIQDEENQFRNISETYYNFMIRKKQ